MAGELFTVSFDPQTLKDIAAFAGFGVLLSDEMQSAFDDAGDPLVASIRGAMHWQNPSGALSDSIHVVRDSPYELQAGSDLPYAHRRNDSFKGPDSLGRMFPNDPAAHFMEIGMTEQQSAILASFDNAVCNVLNRLGAS